MSKIGLVRPAHPARNKGGCIAAALLLASAAACAVPEPTVAELTVPEVVDFQTLQERLEPSSGEKALLVNFWATW